MLNKKYHELGTAPSFIRELFMYGLEQAEIVGEENVFDYSLGNPSIPAPKAINDTICDLAANTESIKLHGYSVAAGFEDARTAVANNLNTRFGADVKASNLFFTCGAAPAIFASFCALAADDNSEIIAIAPFFPEYKVFVENAGAKFKVVPADTDAFQINMAALEDMITANTQAIIINSPNNPSGVVYTEETLSALAELLTEKAGNTDIRFTLSRMSHTGSWYTAVFRYLLFRIFTIIQWFAIRIPSHCLFRESA